MTEEAKKKRGRKRDPSAAPVMQRRYTFALYPAQEQAAAMERHRELHRQLSTTPRSSGAPPGARCRHGERGGRKSGSGCGRSMTI